MEQEREFNRIYAELAGNIYAYFNVCFGVQQAEDLTQEVFLRVWRQLRNGEEARSWRAWSFRCAVNLKNDFLREKLHSRQREEAVMENINAFAPPCSPDNLDIRAAFDRLEPTERELLTLKAMGFNSREIAGLIQSTDSTVRTRLQKARTHFSTLIDKGENA